MSRMTSRPIRPVLWSLVLGGLAALSGCGPSEEIGHYQVPHEDPPDKVRLLGVLFPQDKTTSVFKFMGPESVLKPYEGGYGKLIESGRRSDKPDGTSTWSFPV